MIIFVGKYIWVSSEANTLQVSSDMTTTNQYASENIFTSNEASKPTASASIIDGTTKQNNVIRSTGQDKTISSKPPNIFTSNESSKPTTSASIIDGTTKQNNVIHSTDIFTSNEASKPTTSASIIDGTTKQNNVIHRTDIFTSNQASKPTTSASIIDGTTKQNNVIHRTDIFTSNEASKPTTSSSIVDDITEKNNVINSMGLDKNITSKLTKIFTSIEASKPATYTSIINDVIHSTVPDKTILSKPPTIITSNEVSKPTTYKTIVEDKTEQNNVIHSTVPDKTMLSEPPNIFTSNEASKPSTSASIIDGTTKQNNVIHSTDNLISTEASTSSTLTSIVDGTTKQNNVIHKTGQDNTISSKPTKNLTSNEVPKPTASVSVNYDSTEQINVTKSSDHDITVSTKSPEQLSSNKELESTIPTDNIDYTTYENTSERSTDQSTVISTISSIPNVPSDISLQQCEKDFMNISLMSLSKDQNPIIHYTVNENDNKLYNVTQSYIIIKNPTPCKSYCFKISASNKIGQSAFSEPKCYKTAPNLKSVIIDNIDNLYSKERNISWRYPKEEKCELLYIVEYREKDKKEWSTVQTYNHYKILRKLSHDRKYEVRIKVQSIGDTVCGRNFGNYSDSTTFLTYEPYSNFLIVILFFMFLALLLLCGFTVLVFRGQLNSFYFFRKNQTTNRTNHCEEPQFSDAYMMRNLIETKMPGKGNLKTGIIENEKREKVSLKEVLDKVTNTQHNIHLFGSDYESMKQNKSDGLIDEYKRLAMDSANLEDSLNLTKFIGKSPFNSKKNRFNNIIPFDQNRVLLPGNKFSDNYINASYIPHSVNNDSSEYIATQGPLENTTSDFMMMILDQNVGCIIMLTQIYEKDKIKCEQYWPKEVGETLIFGRQKEITVKLESEKTEISHIERKLLITNSISSNQRVVYHIQMHTWCDYSAPPLDHFNSTLRRLHDLMETTINTPYLVHCSAGVGRTGTFICLDRIVRQLNKGEQIVDVYKTVLELRAYRVFLVQRHVQYNFIYEFLDFFIKRLISEKVCSTGDII